MATEIETLDEQKLEDVGSPEDIIEANEKDDAMKKKEGGIEDEKRDIETKEEEAIVQEEIEIEDEKDGVSIKENKRNSKLSKTVSKSIEPVTLTDRPTRERKTVERYSESSGRISATKPLSIVKGKGTELKDIPNVAFKLSKRKPDENLQLLHIILYGKKTKATTVKKNIGLFSGYAWVENEDKQRTKVREKLEKCVKEKLLDFCDVLNVPVHKSSSKKEDIAVKLLEFLESPHATTDKLLAEKGKKGKKQRGKSSGGKKRSSGATTERPAKKQKKSQAEKRKRSSEEEEEDASDNDDEDADKDDEDADKDVEDADKNDEDIVKDDEDVDTDKEEAPNNNKDTGDESEEEEASPKVESDKEEHSKSEEDEVKPKKQIRKKSVKKDSKAKKPTKSAVKVTAKKASATKQKSDEESDEEKQLPSVEKPSVKKKLSISPTKGQGKPKRAKKAKKVEPTREEIYDVVGNILKEVDFNTATLSDILKQLGSHFNVNLVHRKAEVKDVITDVISNMSDDEDEDANEADGKDEVKEDGDEKKENDDKKDED